MLQYTDVIENQENLMKKAYPNYIIKTLTEDEYHILYYSLKMQQETCRERLADAGLRGITVSERQDLFDEIASLNETLELLKNKRHPFSLGIHPNEEGTFKYDLYVVPLPKDYEKNMFSFLRGVSLLVRDYTDRKLTEG